MGLDKDANAPLVKYMRMLSFLTDDRINSGKEAEKQAPSGIDSFGREPFHSPVSEVSISDLESAVFDAADELEKGLGAEVVLANQVRHPPAPESNKLERCSIIYQDKSDEFHLMSEGLDLLLVARHFPKEQRVDFFFPSELARESLPTPAASPTASPSASHKGDRRRPAFLMTFNEGADEWTLCQTRCDCCVHRPKHLTCEYLGKGQQVARIQHSRKKVGKGLVHNLGVFVPPLLDNRQSVSWCPVRTGKDLGWRTPLVAARSRSGSLSPKKERGNSFNSFGSLNSYNFFPDELDEPIWVRSLLPVWDAEVESLVLNFQGRSNLSSSPRNFMLCVDTEEEKPNTVMQHAQIGKNTWCLDFMHPLSPLQAFAIAMSSIDWA